LRNSTEWDFGMNCRNNLTPFITVMLNRNLK